MTSGECLLDEKNVRLLLEAISTATVPGSCLSTHYVRMLIALTDLCDVTKRAMILN